MRNNRFVSFVVRPRVEGWDVGVGFYIVTFAHFVIAIPGIGNRYGYGVSDKDVARLYLVVVSDKMLFVCTWSYCI